METGRTTSKAPLYWLALGAFAVVTEGFMIAPLLPSISRDLSVSVSAAGLLVTVFAFAYAISSPILTTLTGSLNRRKLLIFSLALFALANLAAWASTDYIQLMAARVLLAFSAGLYVPNANAMGGALVPPEQRGRALAIVNGGGSVAIALGVPLGSLMAAAGNWRTTFACVAVLGALAALALKLGLDKSFGKGFPTATLSQRLRVARNPTVLAALMCTLLWATGAYTVYTYIATYVGATLSPSGVPLSIVLFIWGVSAVSGMVLSGRFTDKLGPQRVLVIALGVLATAFFSLSAISAYVPPASASLPVVVAIILWGASVWGFIPPQQARLIGVGGVEVAPVVLSLNSSFMYIGFSIGAALGGISISQGTVVNLGWTAALIELSSLLLLLATTRTKTEVTSALSSVKR